MPDHTSLESAKAMLCAFTVSSLIRYVYNFNMSMTFLDRGSHPKYWHKETPSPASRCSVAGDIEHQITSIQSMPHQF